MLAKYGSRPDVTEEDLRQCIDDVTSLKENGKLWSPDVYKDMAFDLPRTATPWSRLCACTLPIAQPELLLTALPRRDATMATAL